MTPQDFIRKWKPVALTERATAQEHFLDLCRLFDHPTPAEDDPTGERFTFEKGVPKTGGGDGFGRRLEEGLFRLGIQEEEARPGQGAGAADPLRRGAGKPAAARRLRHPHSSVSRRAWTNEFPRKIRIRARRLGEPRTQFCAASFTIRRSCARAARGQG